MRTKAFLPFITGLVLAYACQSDPAAPAEEPETAGKILLTATLPAAQDFPEDSKFGLFVSEPVNAKNVIMSKGSDGKITPEKDLLWGQGQKDASYFLAYYPYSSGYSEPAEQTFTAPEDQSAEANLNAADFIMGKTSGKPSDSAITLRLEHKMSSLELCFDNRTGKGISKVEVSGVRNKVSFNLNPGTSAASVSPTGEAAAITAFKAPTGSEPVYLAIIAPQTANPEITVTLDGGQTITSVLDSPKEFESGKHYSNADSPIVITAGGGGSISLDFSISDWEDGGQLNFIRVDSEEDMFVKLRTEGIYDITKVSKPDAIFQADNKTQSAVMTGRSQMQFRLIKPFEGRMATVKFQNTGFTIGGSYQAVISTFGDLGISAGDRSLECVNKDSELVWFRDNTNATGYIFSLL